MSFLTNLKALWKNRKLIKEVSATVDTIREGINMNDGKPGWKTTEFWLVVVGNLVNVVGALSGAINAQTAAIVLSILNGVYGLLRTVAKKTT